MSTRLGVYITEGKITQSVTCTSPEECRSKSPFIEYGKIYEVVVHLKEPVDPSSLNRIGDMIQEIRRNWPGISINYLEISSDRKTIKFQIFDPPADVEAQAIATVIVVTACIVAVLVTMKATGFMDILFKVADSVQMITRTFAPPEKPTPPKDGGVGAKLEYGLDLLIYYMQKAAIPIALFGLSAFMIYKLIKR